MTSWVINLTAEVTDWYMALDAEDASLVEQAIDQLAAEGPGLGRPRADQITGSRHHNMKELRAGTFRILFIFDPNREALLLVAWDKRSAGWTRSYKEAIKRAEALYDEHLRYL